MRKARSLYNNGMDLATHLPHDFERRSRRDQGSEISPLSKKSL
jgi:hypothetical protein